MVRKITHSQQWHTYASPSSFACGASYNIKWYNIMLESRPSIKYFGLEENKRDRIARGSSRTNVYQNIRSRSKSKIIKPLSSVRNIIMTEAHLLPLYPSLMAFSLWSHFPPSHYLLLFSLVRSENCLLFLDHSYYSWCCLSYHFSQEPF